MFSPVFALSPSAAAEIINTAGNQLIEKEVLDIDEEAFRENIIAAKLYGYLKVPKNIALLQRKKEPSNVSKPEEDMKEEIADKMGVGKILLGIDAVFNGKLVGKDLSEEWLNGFYRITIGLPEENDALLSIIKRSNHA